MDPQDIPMDGTGMETSAGQARPAGSVLDMSAPVRVTASEDQTETLGKALGKAHLYSASYSLDIKHKSFPR